MTTNFGQDLGRIICHARAAFEGKASTPSLEQRGFQAWLQHLEGVADVLSSGSIQPTVHSHVVPSLSQYLRAMS